MEEKLDILIEVMREQLEVQKSINYNIKQVLNNMPGEVSTSKIERLLEGIGDAVVNL